MIQMFKGQDSEIVGGKQVQQRLIDGWTFSPSRVTSKISKHKITADAKVKTTKQDLGGPKDLTTEE